MAAIARRYACMPRGCVARSCQQSAPSHEPATPPEADGGTKRPCPLAPRQLSAPSLRPLFRSAGCGRVGETLSGRCFGEIVIPKHAWAATETHFVLRRNIRIHGKALSSRWLAIRAVRLGQGLQKTGCAGATPPKTALACANWPFGEVAPGIFPCRKALRPRGPAEALPAGGRSVPHRFPDSRPRLGGDPDRQAVHCHGTVRRSAASNAAFEVNVTQFFPYKPIVFSSYKAASLPSRRFPDVGAGDRIWQLRVP